MIRISFCISLAIFALLPNLLAIMDDDHYVYVDDDVSSVQNREFSTNHSFKADMTTTEGLSEPVNAPTPATQRSDCQCGEYITKREGKSTGRVKVEGE